MDLKFLSWKEGKHFDLWIFVHFLSGTVGGSIVFLLGIPKLWSWILAFAFAIIWEILEWLFKVKEYRENKVIDIFTGMFGFAFSYEFIPLIVPNLEAYIYVTSVEVVLFLILNIFGWKNYKRAQLS